jgi:hypothetical protein
MYTTIETYRLPDAVLQHIPEEVTEVEVEYNYSAASPANFSGDPDTWWEGEDEDFEVVSLELLGTGMFIQIDSEIEQSLFPLCLDALMLEDQY